MSAASYGTLSRNTLQSSHLGLTRKCAVDSRIRPSAPGSSADLVSNAYNPAGISELCSASAQRAASSGSQEIATPRVYLAYVR